MRQMTSGPNFFSNIVNIRGINSKFNFFSEKVVEDLLQSKKQVPIDLQFKSIDWFLCGSE